MNRSLGSLQRRFPVSSGYASSQRSATIFFWIGVSLVLLQFLLPYTVITAIGIDASKVKLHPSVVIALICGVVVLMRGSIPFHQRTRETPGLILFIFSLPLLSAYSIFFNGFSGSAVLPETFWSAGMLALLLESATPKQRRTLAVILMSVVLVNILIGLHETLTQTNWFPLIFDPDADPDKMNAMAATTDEFRAHAFYSHPLTASLITGMGFFLLYAMRLPMLHSAAIFGALLIGLLEFGGRAALGVTLIVSVSTGVVMFFSGIIRRNLKLEFAVMMIGAALAVPLLLAIIVTQTDIGGRIMNTLYFDSSAQARTTQFEVFRYLSMRNWLFGISQVDLANLKYQIGLGGKDTDIENCWILLLFQFGAIGYSVFLFVLGAFTYHLCKFARSPFGWLLTFMTLVVDSGSNSLGVKTADLFFQVAFLVAISGYAGYERPLRVGSQMRLQGRFTSLERPLGTLGPVIARARGLRLLRSRTS
jgi:hypothetical protein